MLRKAMLTMIFSAALTSTGALADTLLIDGVNSSGDQTPARGLDKESVNAEFGNPVSMTDSVGEPPISSWEYPEYTVYFERDLVLHSVAKR